MVFINWWGQIAPVINRNLKSTEIERVKRRRGKEAGGPGSVGLDDEKMLPKNDWRAPGSSLKASVSAKKEERLPHIGLPRESQ